MIHRVLSGGVDLVVKPEGSKNGGLFFTALDLQLLRKCPCAVWILPDQDLSTVRRVMAAVDPDPDDPP